MPLLTVLELLEYDVVVRISASLQSTATRRRSLKRQRLLRSSMKYHHSLQRVTRSVLSRLARGQLTIRLTIRSAMWASLASPPGAWSANLGAKSGINLLGSVFPRILSECPQRLEIQRSNVRLTRWRDGIIRTSPRSCLMPCVQILVLTEHTTKYGRNSFTRSGSHHGCVYIVMQSASKHAPGDAYECTAKKKGKEP